MEVGSKRGRREVKTKKKTQTRWLSQETVCARACACACSLSFVRGRTLRKGIHARRHRAACTLSLRFFLPDTPPFSLSLRAAPLSDDVRRKVSGAYVSELSSFIPRDATPISSVLAVAFGQPKKTVMRA